MQPTDRNRKETLSSHGWRTLDFWFVNLVFRAGAATCPFDFISAEKCTSSQTERVFAARCLEWILNWYWRFAIALLFPLAVNLAVGRSSRMHIQGFRSHQITVFCYVKAVGLLGKKRAETACSNANTSPGRLPSSATCACVLVNTGYGPLAKEVGVGSGKKATDFGRWFGWQAVVG